MDIIKPIKVNYSKVEYEVEDDEKLFQNELDKITEQSFADASTTRTIKNIKETLSKHIKKKYNIKDKNELIDKVNKILAIHGMSDEYFDPMQRFSKFTTDKLNDISVDANANKNELSARGSLKEAETPFDKIIGYDYLYRVMKEMYGQDEAKRLSGEMYDLSLALSDSSCILIPYCYAMDATKLVTIGREFGVLPSKPTHSVDSYIGCLLETIHQLSNHLAGALAIGSFFIDITHLLIYRHRISLDKIKNDKEIRKFLENKFQHFTHSVNSLSRNGGVESPFTNVSIFDKEKLNTLIADYDWYFPKKVQVLVDNNLGGEDYKLSEEEYKKFVIDYIFEVQKIFVDFFDKGDPSSNGINYRFPVTTINLTKKQNENGEYYIDENNELLDFISHKDIARYNIFSSLGTKVASCCFSGDQKVLVKSNHGVFLTTFKEWKNTTPFATYKDGWKVFHNGSWVKAKEVQFPKRDMYKVTTVNNKEITISDNHINPTYDGDKPTVSLTTNDYLMFNTKPLDGFCLRDENLTYEQGFLLGAFVGDGCFGGENKRLGKVYQVTYSLNRDCYENICEIINKALDQMGVKNRINPVLHDGEEVVYARISSEKVVGFIKRFILNPKSSFTKEINMDVLLQSYEFRKGILDGWKSTDGTYLDNRCYSVSKRLMETMEVVCTSLGLVTNITISNPNNSGKCTVKGVEYKSNGPLYQIRWYYPSKNRFVKNVYKMKNNSMFVKIKSIEKVKYDDSQIYCFEMKNQEEPYFTLPNGIITHNCRMINDVEMVDLGSTVNSFGGSGGISLGSHRVVTLDFARMAYEASSYDNYLEILNERVKSAAKILKAHKVLLFKMADMGQEPFIKNGWINMKRMFSTFGVLGLYEAVKILKERFDHKEFNYSKDILEHFSGFCKEAAKEEGIIFNIEQIPAESMAPRLATCDRVLFGNPYNLDKIYANQFVPLWEDVTIYEKMDREGEMDHYLTGGSIAHIQIGSDVTSTQAKKIIQYATKAGCEHFALNAVYTKCEDCGNVIKSKEHKCPKCESKNVTQYTRVVGFFTPVSSWNKDRREWEFPRRKFIDITK